MKILRAMIIIKDIERFFSDLEEMNIKDISDLEKKEKFYAVSMVMFSIVNRAIDLAEEIISYKKIGFPESYRDIFILLEKNGIIDKKLCIIMSDLVHFRNLAAHEYQEFKKEDVFSALGIISRVKELIEASKNIFK